MVEPVDNISGDPQRKAGFAGAAWTREGEQTYRLSFDPVADLLQLGVASDECGGLCRQVVWPTIQGCQRREAPGELWVDQLKELFGSPPILEPVGAEVQAAGTARQPPRHQRRRGARQP